MIHQPLNILQTCLSQSWGALELQALEMTKQLRNRTHRVWLACIRGSRLESEARTLDIGVVALRVTGYVHPLAFAKLVRFIKREGIDVIHCQQAEDIATLVPAMKLSGEQCALVLTKRVGSFVKTMDLFHRFTYAHVDRVLAISDVIHKNVLDTSPVSIDKVITLHDAVDTELFALARVSRERVRREFGFDDDTIVVGFVGAFTPGRGHEELLEAANMLNKKYGNICFVIVGEARSGEQHYEQRIRSMCSSLNLERAVRFAGYRKDMPDVMASFDIFAFPSHAEAFGLALIEAMAMERPVVSTNCDGVLDIVVDGVTGIYVDPRNPKQLADALERLGGDTELREKMGKAGRRRVEEFFDQRRQMARIEEIYYELLDLPSHLKPQHSAHKSAT